MAARRRERKPDPDVDNDPGICPGPGAIGTFRRRRTHATSGNYSRIDDFAEKPVDIPPVEAALRDAAAPYGRTRWTLSSDETSRRLSFGAHADAAQARLGNRHSPPRDACHASELAEAVCKRLPPNDSNGPSLDNT